MYERPPCVPISMERHRIAEYLFGFDFKNKLHISITNTFLMDPLVNSLSSHYGVLTIKVYFQLPQKHCQPEDFNA